MDARIEFSDDSIINCLPHGRRSHLVRAVIDRHFSAVYDAVRSWRERRNESELLFFLEIAFTESRSSAPVLAGLTDAESDELMLLWWSMEAMGLGPVAFIDAVGRELPA